MPKDLPKKEPTQKPPADPYLKELDSSMEDLLAEEPTRFDVPMEKPATKPAGAHPIPPSVGRPRPTGGASLTAEAPKKGVPPLATHVPVEVRVVIGRKGGTLANLLDLKKGEIVELEKGLDPSVELMVADRVIARGELVEVDGRLGVRLVHVLEGENE